eukprot:COSAG02_NODE_1390_length_12915_cov_6.825531_2_plen_99_part_00
MLDTHIQYAYSLVFAPRARLAPVSKRDSGGEPFSMYCRCAAPYTVGAYFMAHPIAARMSVARRSSPSPSPLPIFFQTASTIIARATSRSLRIPRDLFF